MLKMASTSIPAFAMLVTSISSALLELSMDPWLIGMYACM